MHRAFSSALYNSEEAQHTLPLCARALNPPTECCPHDNHVKVCPYWPDLTQKHMHSNTFFQSMKNAKHVYDSKYPFSLNWNKKENMLQKKLMKGKLSSFFSHTHTQRCRQSLQFAGLFELFFISFRFEWMRRARLDWWSLLCLFLFIVFNSLSEGSISARTVPNIGEVSSNGRRNYYRHQVIQLCTEM